MRTKEQTEAIRAALEELAKRGDGTLTPDAVVDAARSKDSPLHPYFEWNQKAAAAAYLIEQARVLIRSVRVVVTVEKMDVRTVAYVRDPDAEADEQGYVSTVALMDDAARARRTLVDEFTRAAAALRRARELALVFSMVDEIDAVTDTISSMRARVTARITDVPPPH